MRPAVLLALAVGSLSAAPVPKELRAPSDAKLLVGTWQPADNSAAWFRFRADGTLQTWGASGTEIGWTWTDLDTKSTPKRMTLTRLDGSGGYTCPYELSGGTLKLAMLAGRHAVVPPTGLHFRLLARDKPAE